MALIVALSGPLPGPVGAGEPVFTFAELTDDDLQHIDLHDGCIDDWLEVVGEPALRGRDAHRLVAPVPVRDYDPTDFDFRIWLAWHDASNRIYVAMESFDDEYINQFDRHGTQTCAAAMGCWDSHVELWLDGDRSAGAFVSLDDMRGPWDRARAQAEVGAQQWYRALPETHDTGPHVELGFLTKVPIDWPVHLPFSDGDGRTFGLDPVFSVVEFYVTPFDHLDIDSPQASRVTDLCPGHLIRFTIRLYDLDEAGGATYCFESSLADEFDLTTMPDGTMVGKIEAGQGLDRLSEATWATVKHANAVDSTAVGVSGD